ncbi:MAG: aminopeptidase P family protein [Gammaproteobacteria bacterium CG_4_10_14_0_8_um_filter_38_16]|nr:MAG: aminopeptidase P family protein [Gammaproteobacteria bacterium CG_4_10_14_0_8_um_filter_38_16]PJA03909.1 MAG: aminopeptidase P family protein [Gammaproteobacteria bacterium CG_4_10_14_0_2_um_filter_38_22]PJB09578.1 MAG: aminopeptidase P family protein [Gammaproteobacteria bacterium CG_4_9_14_3_um_filter_38_9]
MMQSVSEKLKNLRQQMLDHKVDFYYVPTRDAHNNEYVPDHWQRRTWLTGFTGSYGEALVGLEQAYLWTDPRYYLQASLELDAKQFQLMKQLQGVAAPVSAWLGENAFKSTVGVDPKLISMAQSQQWSLILSRVHGKLTPILENLVDQVWVDHAPLQFSPVRLLDLKYTGLSATKKLEHVRDAMKKIGVDALVVSQLDEVAWLFNIRGNDVPYNPLVIAYAIITMEKAFLFVHADCIASADHVYFEKEKVTIQSYDQFENALHTLAGNVWVDPATTSWWVALQLSKAFLVEKKSPILLMKAIKNKTELKGMREAHRIDAIAVVKFLQWIENHWRDGVDEISAADQLEKFRREDKRCLDLSFPTICGFADHGAIVHYRASPESKHTITDKEMLLVDSGGQYFEGTTDITRTIHLGVPTLEQKKHYTLVLKGHLALRNSVFPDGACGEHVNTIARMPLWAAGMDFGHGTGHGVGCYLCVHEGPQRIAYGATGVPLKPNMIVSNEPGLYFSGKYGIRIENLCEIVEKIAEKDSLTGNGPFYGMADLTMVPYARKLIDVDLLATEEIEWINAYHRDIYNLLEKDFSIEVRNWLKEETKPL